MVVPVVVGAGAVVVVVATAVGVAAGALAGEVVVVAVGVISGRWRCGCSGGGCRGAVALAVPPRCWRRPWWWSR